MAFPSGKGNELFDPLLFGKRELAMALVSKPLWSNGSASGMLMTVC